MSWNNNDFRRRHMEREEEKKSKSGNKQYTPYEMEQVGFRVNESFYLRVLRTDATYTRAFHWPQGGGPHTCTRDIPMFEEKCCFCQKYDSKSRGKRKEIEVLEVIDFRYFHIVPHPTKRGKETIERCEHDEPDVARPRCKHCLGEDERSSVRYFGGHKVLEMNDDQYGSLWAAHDKLSQTCIHVDEKGGLCGKKSHAISYVCPNPKCEFEFVDERKLRDLSTAELNKIIDHKQDCPECQNKEYPFGIYACGNEGRTPLPSEVEDASKGKAPSDATHWVTRGAMFDKVLEFTIVPEEKRIGDNDVTLKHFNISTGEGWSAVSDDLEAFGFNTEEIEEMCKPWDLDYRYRPEFLKREDGESDEDYVARVLDKQSESIGEPNPFKEAGGRRRFGGEGGARSFRS